MAKSKVFLVLSLISLPIVAKEFKCYSVIEGEEVGGKFETALSFNSTAPKLERSITITPTGGTPSTTVTQLLSADSVCAVPSNFAAKCKGVEKTFNGEYWYNFDCTDGISGQIGLLGTGTMIYCQGPGVDPSLKGGVSYEGCK